VAAGSSGVGATTFPVTVFLVATPLLLILGGQDEAICRDGNDQGTESNAEHEPQRIAA
jgi:hypothetical protein